MKRIIFIMAAALSLVACNTNDPDTKKGGDTQTNQPADPSTWTPAGKRYVRDYGTINNDGFRYEIVHFFSTDSAESFYATSDELTPINYLGTVSMHWGYNCAYPNIRLTRHQDYVPFVFLDTITLKYENSEGVFVLH